MDIKYFRMLIDYRLWTEKDEPKVIVKWYNDTYKGDLLKSYTTEIIIPPYDSDKEYFYSLLPHLLKDIKDLITDTEININELYKLDSLKKIEDYININYLAKYKHPYKELIINEYM